MPAVCCFTLQEKQDLVDVAWHSTFFIKNQVFILIIVHTYIGRPSNQRVV